MRAKIARHSETLEWFAVMLATAPEGDEAFYNAIQLKGDFLDLIEPNNDLKPTHTHYKGHEYQAFGDAKVQFSSDLHVFYGDREGRNWLRPKHMFYDKIEDGRHRFTQMTE
jgi:hypothetical protein